MTTKELKFALWIGIKTSGELGQCQNSVKLGYKLHNARKAKQ